MTQGLTQEQFFSALEQIYARNVSISRMKNADYASGADPFQNFRVCDAMTGGAISVEMGIFVRLCDKFQRAANLLQRNAKVSDESIQDTLADLCNYSAILSIYLSEQRKVV
jgi:hypothetical protein